MMMLWREVFDAVVYLLPKERDFRKHIQFQVTNLTGRNMGNKSNHCGYLFYLEAFE